MVEKKLLSLLSGEELDIIVKENTVSTSSDARQCCNGEPIRAVLITADSQSGGRGRQGKSFISPTGGLYMSLLIPTDMPISQALSATSCAAVGVRRAIYKVCGAECGIKWINDLYLHGGKLCGILAESVNDYSAMMSRYLIIGVGVNIGSSPALHGADVRAVSLAEYGFHASPEELCAEITRELLLAYRCGFDFSLYEDEYRAHSILIGREITFIRDGNVEYGIAENITDRGALSVRCADKTVILDSGEVSVRIR